MRLLITFCLFLCISFYGYASDISGIVENLNSRAGDPDYLQEYLDTVNTPSGLMQTYEVGVHYLSSPECFKDQGAQTFQEGKCWADSRALHLLNFVHLVDANIHPWLPYHYALSLIYFDGLAKTLFGYKDPIARAFKIYDQWLENCFTERLAETIQIEEYEGIQMDTFAIHDKKEEYDLAHSKFYALLSMKLSLSLRSREVDEITPYEKQLVFSLHKYEPPYQPNNITEKAANNAKWLDGPLVFGMVAVPALIMAHKSVQFFDY